MALVGAHLEASEEFSTASGNITPINYGQLIIEIFLFRALPGRAIGVKKGAINGVFDTKIKLLQSLASLASGGGSRSSSSHSAASSSSFDDF